MDGNLDTATQGEFGHWELTPEPSTAPTTTQQQHSHLSPELLWHKREGKRTRKAKRVFGSRHLLQRGRMLITLGMKRECDGECGDVTGQRPGWNCPGMQHRHQARGRQILVCSSSPSSKVTNASLFPRPALPDLIRHRAHTPSQICCYNQCTCFGTNIFHNS